MNPIEDKSENRRELLRSIGRAVALGSMAGLGGMAIYRNSNLQAGENCVIIDPCQACKIFDHCALPKASTARRIDKELNHE